MLVIMLAFSAAYAQKPFFRMDMDHGQWYVSSPGPFGSYPWSK